MITYCGVAISLNESTEFNEEEYKVHRTDGLIFKAASVYGKSFGRTAEQAVEGAKKQIDRSGK